MDRAKLCHWGCFVTLAEKSSVSFSLSVFTCKSKPNTRLKIPMDWIRQVCRLGWQLLNRTYPDRPPEGGTGPL